MLTDFMVAISTVKTPYVDNDPVIAMGREASAYPKKLGIPKRRFLA